jgi:hypothetical protein
MKLSINQAMEALVWIGVGLALWKWVFPNLQKMQQTTEKLVTGHVQSFHQIDKLNLNPHTPNVSHSIPHVLTK